MRTIKLLLPIIAVSFNVVFAQEKKVTDDIQTAEETYLKLPRIQVLPITDTKTDRQYELYIKLPEGYAENENIQYPVLYTTDAMWHIELLSASTEYIIEDVILVGISWQKDLNEDFIKEEGEHVSRYRDYSIRASSNLEYQAKYQFGQASNHLSFIRNDVIRYVENKYRTDPTKRTYFGYSMGGGFGAYILLSQPDTFKNYILGSPSLKGNIPYLSELAKANAVPKKKDLNAKVFVSYGSLEKELGELVEEFIAIVKNSKSEHLSLYHVVLEGSHQTAFPMTGVRGVTWLSDLVKE